MRSPRPRRAFSLRQNLRLLFVPAEDRLRPLDGIRALSMLWVVLFHAGWYIGLYIPTEDYVSLLSSRWMLPVWRGDFGVDVFFVLSGFLIAGTLIDERERTGRVRMARFYARRLFRLWPALGVAVVLDVIFHPDNAQRAWANLLYVTNLVPVVDGRMGWTWSLAMEEQFYLVCPWFLWAVTPLRPSRRIAVVALLALALCGVAACVVIAGDFTVFDSEIVLDRSFARWAVGYDHLYVKPWMRAGGLLMGVGAAFVYRSSAAMSALAERRVVSTVALVVCLVVAGVCMQWPIVAGAPRGVEVAFLSGYRTIFGASIAYLLLVSLSRNAAGAAVGRLLSSRILYPLGQVAYSAYLLNPIVTNLVDRRLAPLVAGRGAAAFFLFLPFDTLGTLLAAAMVYLFVERPFMELRPRV